MLESIQSAVNQFDECRNWFDVAACCFCFIDSVLSSEGLTEENYISRYIETPAEAPRSNPNRVTQDYLIGVCREIMFKELDDHLSFQEALTQIRNLILTLNFQPYLEEKVNESTALWSLIVAVDSFYAETDLDLRM